MKKTILLLLSPLLLAAQELPRRPFLGIRMTRVTEDVRRVMSLPAAKGVLLEEVFNGSTAEKAGFLKGDVLLMINDVELLSPDHCAKLIGELETGASFSYTMWRNNKTRKGKATIAAMPSEKYQGLEVIYESVSTVNGLQRIIVSKKPGTAKKPAIVFIGGIGCYSLDFPFEQDRPEALLLKSLSEEGYVSVRAEKPGVGDNRKCTPCNEVSFENEMIGYTEAVKKVKSLPYVDSTAVYIFGHSMGGVMAPSIAARTTVKGILAFGTIGSNFLEYLAKTRRTLADAYRMDLSETDDYIKTYCECATWYFADGLSTEEAAKKNPDCREYLSIFDLRSRDYNQQLYSFNIPAEWKKFKGKALLMYGTSDFVASREDHEIIVTVVNKVQPGNAEFLMLQGVSHGMTTAPDFQSALEGGGKYDRQVSEAVIKWLRKTCC